MRKRRFMEDGLALAGCFVVCLLFYGVFLFPHYGHDTFIVARMPVPEFRWVWENYGYMYISAGRYTAGALMSLLGFLGIQPLSTAFFPRALSIALMAVGWFLCFRNIRTYFSFPGTRVAAWVGSAFIFCNPYLADWFHFPENTAYYCGGLLGMLLAAQILFSHRGRWRYAASFALVVLSVGIYQILLSFFVLFVVLLALLSCLAHPAETPGALARYAKGVLPALGMYIGAGVLQLGISRIFGGNHRITLQLRANLQVILDKQSELWRLGAVGIDNLLFPAACAAAAGLFLWLCLRKRESRGWALLALCSWGAFYLSMFVSHLLAEPWFSHRTTATFPALLSCFLLPCLQLAQLEKTAFRRAVTRGAICLGAAVLLLFGYKTARLGVDLLKTNAMDEQICHSVEQAIRRYEEETGETVTKAAVFHDAEVTWSYPGCDAYYDLNIRTWPLEWAALNMMHYFTGRELERVEGRPDIVARMSAQNWDAYSDAQVFLEGDTAYLCVY